MLYNIYFNGLCNSWYDVDQYIFSLTTFSIRSFFVGNGMIKYFTVFYILSNGLNTENTLITIICSSAVHLLGGPNRNDHMTSNRLETINFLSSSDHFAITVLRRLLYYIIFVIRLVLLPSYVYCVTRRSLKSLIITFDQMFHWPQRNNLIIIVHSSIYNLYYTQIHQNSLQKHNINQCRGWTGMDIELHGLPKYKMVSQRLTSFHNF